MQQDETATFHFVLSMIGGIFLYIVAAPLFGSPDGYGAWLRVEWIPLLLFFWGQRRPNWPPLWIPWLCGLFVDVLRADPLGFNALCFLLLTWLLSVRFEWFRTLALLEQCLALLLFLCIYQAATLGVLLLVGRDLGVWWMSFMPPLITAALWPISTVILARIHSRALNV